MSIGKLLCLLAIVRLLCIPCLAENAVEPFSAEWIELYQVGASFPDVNSQSYSVQDGVLFQGNKLVAYPREKAGKEYRVPDGTEMIASGAFDGNCYLEKVILPSTITCIGDDAFVGCAELKEINLPERLLVIGSGAFAQCYSLESITLPPNLYVIGGQAFCEASALTGKLTIPSSVKYIGEEVLCYTNISTIVFEGCVYHVGYSLIGEPNPQIYYEIQVPDLSFAFAEALQEEYARFEYVIVREPIPQSTAERCSTDSPQ